jgi:hypothetical protein
MGFKDDLKRGLGAPLFDVELHEESGADEDDYKYIERRVLRRINEYIPYIVCVVKTNIPAGSSGKLDLTSDNFFNVFNTYVVGRRQQLTAEAALVWHMFYAQSYQYNIIWPSEFIVSDYALYKNQLYNMRKTYNSSFNWKYMKNERNLYLQNVPTWATGVGVEGYRFVESMDDVDDRWMGYDVALEYAEGLAMQMIGRKFDKYKHSGLELPGEKYLSDGKDKIEKAEEDMKDLTIIPSGLSDEA